MIKDFTPRLYQQTILGTAANFHTLVVLPTGMGKCLFFDEPVLLSDGSLQPIGKLVEEQILNGKTIQNKKEHIIISPNHKIKVISLNQNLKFEEENVSYLHKIKTNKQLLQVTTESGSKVTVTPEHPFLSLDDNLEWKRADSLSKGQHIAVPKYIQVKSKNIKINFISLFMGINGCRVPGVILNKDFAREQNLPLQIPLKNILSINRKKIERNICGIFFKGAKCVDIPIKPVWRITPNLCYWLGLLIAEGRISGGVKFYNNDQTLLNEFTSLSKKIFGLTPETIEGGLLLRSTALVQFLRAAFNLYSGQHSRDKIIHNSILRSSQKCVSNILAGLFDGEAHVAVKDYLIEFITASQDMANKICYLLLRFGIKARYKEKWSQTTNSPNPTQRKYHLLRIIGQENLQKFSNEIKFRNPQKKKALEKYISYKKIPNTNVDLLPLSKIIRNIRTTLRLSSTKRKHFDLASIDTYENGLRKPSREMLQKIVSGFENKLDHLIKIDKEMHFLQSQAKILELPLTDYLIEVSEKLNSPVYEFVKNAKISKTQFDSWILGKCEPKLYLGSPFYRFLATLPFKTSYENFDLKVTLSTLAQVREKMNLALFSLRSKNIFVTPITRTKLLHFINVVIENYDKQLQVKQEIIQLKNLISAPVQWDKVKEIKLVSSKYVYDLTVNKNHNFIAGFNGGAVIHNTALAFLLAAQRLHHYPNSKILMLAPTKPLCEQHLTTFQKHFNLPTEKMVLFTGSVKPEKREQLWKEAQVIISTPQGLENDVINKRIKLAEVSLLIFDEGHHATGDYAYVWIADQYEKLSNKPRILALTASPGSDLEKIKEICQNLKIEKVEVRTEEDPDVKPYIQQVKFNWTKVKFPEKLQEIQSYLKNSRKSKLLEAQKYGYCTSSDLNKTQLLKLQGELQRQLSSGVRDFEILKSVSLIAEALKVDHSLELLESQGLTPLTIYFQKLQSESLTTKVKAVKNLMLDVNFKSAIYLTNELQEKGFLHPKLTKLTEIVEEVIQQDDQAKIIIFTQFRDSAEQIIEQLNKFKTHIFVGQAKKKGLGFSQKEQKEILDKFRNNQFNILVATSVAEEGLDIPKVDKVIFYEPVPSAIRTIQRKGRTGRLEKGEVTILVTENTRDVGYRWAAHHKEKRMYRNLNKLKTEFSFLHEKKPLTLQKFIPEEQVVAVLADHREKSNRIVKELINLGISVKTAQLESADYLLSGRVGVELKKVPDFVASIIDGRLLEQVRSLRNNFEKAVLIIEGEEDIYSIRKVHANAIRGMLSSIVLDFQVPVLYTKNPQDTAGLLAVMAKREQDKSRDFSYHEHKPQSIKEQQEFLVSSLPNIGVQTARLLLEHFSSIKNLINAKKDEITNIKGVGDKTADKLTKLFAEEYIKKD